MDILIYIVTGAVIFYFVVRNIGESTATKSNNKPAPELPNNYSPELEKSNEVYVDNYTVRAKNGIINAIADEPLKLILEYSNIQVHTSRGMIGHIDKEEKAALSAYLAAGNKYYASMEWVGDEKPVAIIKVYSEQNLHGSRRRLRKPRSQWKRRSKQSS